jgi:hypothetical protein
MVCVVDVVGFADREDEDGLVAFAILGAACRVSTPRPSLTPKNVWVAFLF